MAEVNLKKEEVLHVAIGQKGIRVSGSGGTFVIREFSNGSFEPIVIAGGAGGDGGQIGHEWCNAQLNEFGNGSKSGEINNNIGGSGNSGETHYNGGAGYKTNPPNSQKNYPKSFQDGLQGCHHGCCHDLSWSSFGGGGVGYDGNGGGGGYTGGNGSSDNKMCGGGGGSFNIDPNGTKSLGWFDDGKCEIKFLKTYYF